MDRSSQTRDAAAKATEVDLQGLLTIRRCCSSIKTRDVPDMEIAGNTPDCILREFFNPITHYGISHDIKLESHDRTDTVTQIKHQSVGGMAVFDTFRKTSRYTL